jgi:hypothetical protein
MATTPLGLVWIIDFGIDGGCVGTVTRTREKGGKEEQEHEVGESHGAFFYHRGWWDGRFLVTSLGEW